MTQLLHVANGFAKKRKTMAYLVHRSELKTQKY
jgi:hypothetical protein